MFSEINHYEYALSNSLILYFSHCSWLTSSFLISWTARTTLGDAPNARLSVDRWLCCAKLCKIADAIDWDADGEPPHTDLKNSSNFFSTFVTLWMKIRIGWRWGYTHKREDMEHDGNFKLTHAKHTLSTNITKPKCTTKIWNELVTFHTAIQPLNVRTEQTSDFHGLNMVNGKSKSNCFYDQNPYQCTSMPFRFRFGTECWNKHTPSTMLSNLWFSTGISRNNLDPESYRNLKMTKQNCNGHPTLSKQRTLNRIRMIFASNEIVNCKS